MKRPTSLLVLACATVALAGCGSASNSTPSAGADDTVVDAAVETDSGTDVVVDDDEAQGFADLENEDVSDGGSDASADAPDDATSNSAATFVTPIGGAGTVEFAVSGDAVSLLDVQLAAGWNETNRSISDDEVELDLRSATVSIDVDAEIESGSVLDVDVDTEIQTASGAYVESTIAGDITIVFDGEMVTVAAIDLLDGWAVTGQTADDDEVELTLANASTGDTVRIDAELDDGRGDIDTRTRIAIGG